MRAPEEFCMGLHHQVVVHSSTGGRAPGVAQPGLGAGWWLAQGTQCSSGCQSQLWAPVCECFFFWIDSLSIPGPVVESLCRQIFFGWISRDGARQKKPWITFSRILYLLGGCSGSLEKLPGCVGALTWAGLPNPKGLPLLQSALGARQRRNTKNIFSFFSAIFSNKCFIES